MPVMRTLIAGYPQISVTPTSGSMTFQYGIYGRDISDFMYEIFPPNSATNLYVPEADPLSGKYRASSCNVEPFNGDKTPFRVGATDSDADMYDNPINSDRPTWRATVVYSSIQRTYDDGDDNTKDPVTMLSHSISIGGEYITLGDEAKLKWGNYDGGGYTESAFADAPQRGIQAGFPLPTQEHTVQWHRVVSPPFRYIYDVIGSINSDVIEYNVGKFYPQTVLFLGAEISRDILSNGQRAWSVTYRFSVRKIDSERVEAAAMLTYDGVGYGGWNHFYDEKAGFFRFLLKKNGAAGYGGTDSLVFPMRDFSPGIFTQV
jgi:hypothetical protein